MQAQRPEPRLGEHALSMPPLGLGTYRLQGETCATLVAGALGAGYRHLDTAEIYGNEAAVGEGFRASGIARSEVFMTTKVWREGLGAGEVERRVEASLMRLGVDYVDLILVHWPNADIPLGETLDAFARVKRRGLARAIGVSNFTVALLNEAAVRSPEPIAVNQVEYHPYLNQDRVLAAARSHQITLMAYSPLAQGRVNDDPVLTAIGEEHGVGAAQVALRWLLQQNVAAIPKTASLERARTNLTQVVGFELTDPQMQAIAALADANGRTVDMPFAPNWDPVCRPL